VLVFCGVGEREASFSDAAVPENVPAASCSFPVQSNPEHVEAPGAISWGMLQVSLHHTLDLRLRQVAGEMRHLRLQDVSDVPEELARVVP